jgi:hypothetical protein
MNIPFFTTLVLCPEQAEDFRRRNPVTHAQETTGDIPVNKNLDPASIKSLLG